MFLSKFSHIPNTLLFLEKNAKAQFLAELSKLEPNYVRKEALNCEMN